VIRLRAMIRRAELSAELDPDKHRGDYRVQVFDPIGPRTAGEELERPAIEGAEPRIVAMTAAREASVGTATATRGRHRSARPSAAAGARQPVKRSPATPGHTT
jgi:hypothetical protein